MDWCWRAELALCRPFAATPEPPEGGVRWAPWGRQSRLARRVELSGTWLGCGCLGVSRVLRRGVRAGLSLDSLRSSVCLSRSSVGELKSYQHEELLLAVD